MDDGLAAQSAVTEFFQYLPGGIEVNGGTDARGDHTFISAIPDLSTGGPGSLIQLNELNTDPL